MTRRSSRIDDALADFGSVPLAVRGYSARTRVEYHRDLREFVRYLSDRCGVTHLRTLDHAHLTAYLANLEVHRLKTATRRRRVSAVRSFLGFLHIHGYTTSNLAVRLTPPPRERHDPVFLSQSQYQALERAAGAHARDAAIVELFLQTGIRLSELAGLRTVDLTLQADRTPDGIGYATVRGRGRRLRTVTLNWKACHALKVYLTARPDASTDALFLSKFKTPLTPRAIRNVVKKHLRTAGIDVNGVSVHTLRHTFGMQHALCGTTHELIQDTMGLASIRAVDVYADRIRQDGELSVHPHAL